MANEWMSALPSAFKPVNVNQDIFGGQSAGQRALSVQQAAGQAVTNAAANQERIRKQALQDAVSKAWRTAIGPNGKLIKVFDKERFLAAAGPAGADAYKMYAETMFPQEGKEAVQRGVLLNAAGGVDPTKTVAEAQRSPYGLDLIKAASGLQKEQAATGADIAGNLMTTNTLAQPGTARPGTLLGNEQMQPRDLTAIGTPGADNRVTPAQIRTLDRTARESALYNLRQAGTVLPPTASDADIANAINAIGDTKVQALLGGGKLTDLPSTVFGARQKQGSTRQESNAAILGGSLDYQGKKTGVAASGLSLESAQAGVSTAREIADELHVPGSKRGGLADPAKQQALQGARNAVSQLRVLDQQMTDLNNRIKSGAINMATPEGNNEVNTELAGMLTKLTDIYGQAGTEGGVARAFKDMGAPPDLVEAITRGGISDAARSWFAGKVGGNQELLQKATQRAAGSVISALERVNSSDPGRVLTEAGLGHLVPKSTLKPSVFKPSKPTKGNPLGLDLGAKR